MISTLLFAAHLFGLTATPSQKPAVFPVGVEAVYLDVFVTRHGEPVTGLASTDFELRDNGVLQQPRLVDVDTVGVTAVLAFDASGSVAGRKLERLKAAGHAFVDGLGARDQAALLTFSQDVVAPIPATPDRAALHQALERLEGRGATAVRDALYLGLKLPWAGGRLLLVLFTDGEDNLSWLGPDDVLTAARESDVLVHVVASEEPALSGASGRGGSPRWPSGVRSREESAHRRLLRQVAETTGGALWTATAEGLEERFLQVLRAMRTRYLLGYEPQGVERPGRHRLKVAVRRPHVDVRARTEYTVSAR